MSIFLAEGQIRTARVRLSGVTATTIIDAGKSGTLVDNIHVCNMGAGTPDITIDCYDVTNTTAYVLVQEHSLTARGTESTELGVPKSIYDYILPFNLPATWLLRVTSTVGSSVVHVTATHVKPPQRT